MITEKMRESFELTYAICWLDEAEVCKVWERAWNASREALVIDLRHEDEEKLCSFDYGAGYRAARNIAHQSIRAAGLKVAQ